MSENNIKNVLTVNDRKSVSLNGVNNVLGFDEGYVTLDTALGRVGIEGNDLKIESLSKENGVIFISGNISGVYYSEPKEGGGIFKRMFK